MLVIIMMMQMIKLMMTHINIIKVINLIVFIRLTEEIPQQGH